MIKKFCLSIILLLAPMVAMGQAAVLADNCSSASCQAVSGGVNDAAGGAPANPSTLDSDIKTGINLLSIVVGVVSIAMIIVAGLRYSASAGNAEKIKAAKNTLIYAIVGVVIASMAPVIAHFALSEAQTPNTEFTNPPPAKTTPPAGAGHQ